MGIDIGIITIKPEEFFAIISRLNGWDNLSGYKHEYIHQLIPGLNGLQYNVAVARCLEPGTGSAQSLAEDIIEELNPTWLLLVGIAGGVPTGDYSLGDVLLCTRLYDFSVCCIKEDTTPAFDVRSDQVHPKAKKLLEVIPAYASRLETHGWNSLEELRKERPTVNLGSASFAENLYGDERWKRSVEDSLRQNFAEPRKPKYHLGPVGSSDRLVKSTSLLGIWLDSARSLTAVEMELAGVYRAAERSNIPVLAIRSLSDIVGYKRSSEWTQFACEAAASFTICLIKAGILDIASKSPSVSTRDTRPMNSAAEIQTIQDGSTLLLTNDSPFHPFGMILLDHPSYIKRNSDGQLEKLLSSYSFICLYGDFCSGKSSLLIRVPRMLLGDWKVFRPRLDLYPPRRKGALERSFFDELKKADETMDNWISLSEMLEENKLAFLIDEIQRYLPEDARLFIEQLYALFEHAPNGHLLVVMSIKGSLDIYIRNIGLANPKYINCWETIELTKFNDDELIELLNLFPQPIALSLRENLSTIKEHTSMEPHAIQQLCDDLWKHLRGKAIPMNNINQEIKLYLNGYAKV